MLVSFLLFLLVVCFLECLSHKLQGRVKGTRQPPDGGARQQFYCTPGVLIFSCICSSSDFISGYVFGYFPSSSVSLYFSDSFDFLVVFISCDLMFF